MRGAFGKMQAQEMRTTTRRSTAKDATTMLTSAAAGSALSLLGAGIIPAAITAYGLPKLAGSQNGWRDGWVLMGSWAVTNGIQIGLIRRKQWTVNR